MVASSYRHFYDKKKKIFKQGSQTKSQIMLNNCSKSAHCNIFFFMFAGSVIVTCLPPIPTKGLTMKDLNDLIDKVWKQMQETIDKTTEEVERNLRWREKEQF